MVKSYTDSLGQNVQVGDAIVYPTKRGSSGCSLNYAKVVDIKDDGTLRVAKYKKGTLYNSSAEGKVVTLLNRDTTVRVSV